MTTPAVEITRTEGYYPSFNSMRAAHADLLHLQRQDRESSETTTAAQEFLKKGCATGCILDNEDEREAAQSLLDYWATTLYRHDVVVTESSLAEFDPSIQPEIPDELCPYRGLNAFVEGDSSVFFGRSRLVNELVDRLRVDRILAVIGSSGSGKSSVVRAGLIPALKSGALPSSDSWIYLPVVIPGSQPLKNLINLVCPAEVDATKVRESDFIQDPSALLKLLESCYKNPVVIVVDQFEEIFALCDDPQQRQALAANLQALADAPGKEHRVILTMRVDFESRVATLPVLQPAFEKNVVRVTPLNAAELRQAIEDPASLVGLKFESGVVDALLNDILGEPAALPLLQFTLLKLWENRERNRVTWEAFRKLGGGRQALANSADEFYDNLIHEEQVTARRILLRLVRPGEGLEVTSRRMRREELYIKAEARDRIDRVLDKFVQARLLRLTRGNVAADDQVEVAHEALVRNWPALVNWLEDERQTIRERQRLTNAAERWQALGRDKSALLRGVLLEEALRWEDLSDLETAYVEASKQQRTDEIAEAQRTAAILRRRAQIITIVAGAALLAAVVAVFFGMSSLVNLQAANVAKALEVTQRQAAQTSEAQAKEKSIALEISNAEILVKQTALYAAVLTAEYALHQADTALRAEATATAQVGFQQATAVAADQFAQSQQVLAASRSLSEQARGIAPRQPDLGNLLGLLSIQLLGDNQQPASLEAQGVLLDTLRANPRLSGYLRGHTGTVNSVAYNPKGDRLASASSDGTVRLWDTHTGELLDVISPTVSVGGLNTVAFGVRGNANLLAVGGCATLSVGGCGEGLIQFYDASNKLIPTTTRKAHRSTVLALAFDPTGTFIASGGADGIVYIWRTPSVEVKEDSSNPISVFKGVTGQPIRAIAYSPDNRYLVSAGQDGLVSVRDVQRATALITFDEQKVPVNALAFSPDSRLLATGSEENTITLYDLQSQSRLSEPLRGHTFPVTGLAFSPDKRYLASASLDGTLILWELSTIMQRNVQQTGALQPMATLIGHTDAVRCVAISPDSRFLASGGQDKTVILWNANPGLPLGITMDKPDDPVIGLGFSSDGQNLLVGRNDQTLSQWDVESAKASGGTWWMPAGDTLSLAANTSFLFFPPADSPAGLRLSQVSGGEVKGVDVSFFQGQVDWGRVKSAGYAFAYLRASSGMEEDKSFFENWITVKDARLLRGAYHYFRPSLDPIFQADFFAKIAYPEKGDLPPVLDLETTEEQSIENTLYAALAFLEEYQNVTGLQPVIFTGPSFWNKLVEQSSIAARAMPPFEKISGQYRLWVAYYSTSPSPMLPTGWSNWTFWQYAGQENVDGIQGGVGVSRFNGTLEELQALASAQASEGITSPVRQAMSLYNLMNQETIGVELPMLSASSAALDPSRKTLAIGSDNGTITFWDVQQGQQAGPTLSASGSSVTSLVFSEDVRWLAAGSADGSVNLWNMNANPPTRRSLLAHTSAVLSLAFSKNKTLLASGSADGSIVLWDMSALYLPDNSLSSEQVTVPTVGQPLSGPQASVAALAFSPDSKLLASGNADGSLVLWDVDPASWQAKAARYASRPLSEDEKAKYLLSGFSGSTR